MEKETLILNSFCVGSVIFLTKPVKDSVRAGNYRPASFMDINAKIVITINMRKS